MSIDEAMQWVADWNKVPGEVGPNEVCARTLAAEIERLRAIVAKLPVTADGVPVVPGMSIWTMLNGTICEVKCNTIHGTGEYTKCYSTCEAAEAGATP